MIEVPLAIGGIPFVLVDTAGVRESQDVVESIGIERAQYEAQRSDLLLWLGAPAEAPAHPDLILVHPKSDLDDAWAMTNILAVSAVTGEGLARLTQLLIDRSRKLLPKGDELTLDRRQHDLLADAEQLWRGPSGLSDAVLVAEELRNARLAVDRIAGRAGVEDLLDALFGRFCLGK